VRRADVGDRDAGPCLRSPATKEALLPRPLPHSLNISRNGRGREHRPLCSRFGPFQGTDGISPNDSEALTFVENCKGLVKHSEIEPPFSGQRACARPLIRKNWAVPEKGLESA
jgi:hypothetical protein